MSHHSSTSQPASHFARVRKSDDKLAAIDAKKERKKRQNLLNQRAHRQRIADEKHSDQASDRRSYRVHRWRINEAVPSTTIYNSQAKILPMDTLDIWSQPKLSELAHSFVENSEIKALDIEFPTSVECFKTISSTGPHFFSTETSMMYSFDQSSLEFSLSPDHLLHLIHHNVFRALIINKSILGTNASLTKPDVQIPILSSNKYLCDGLTVIHPLTGKGLPPSLHPTPIQMSYPHSSWINMIPYPRIRDNLIKCHDLFDHEDLCNDLFGEIYPNYTYLETTPFWPNTSAVRLSLVSSSAAGPDDDDMFTQRNGLIVWGEPWDLEGWEATPSFVRKWAWLLEGCDELIGSSNRWRAARGEQPLNLIL